MIRGTLFEKRVPRTPSKNFEKGGKFIKISFNTSDTQCSDRVRNKTKHTVMIFVSNDGVFFHKRHTAFVKTRSKQFVLPFPDSLFIILPLFQSF